jgi:RNA polymerase sigma-70 factor (ECF subfamily)
MVRVCGNHADAEDVLIEALLKAYKHLDQLRDSIAFRSWLAQIAKRVCWQLRERESLLPLLQLSQLENEGKEIPQPGEALDVQIAASEMKDIVRHAIERLPNRYRQVYELRDVDELSGEEVASRLGLSVAAMKSRLHRARRLVREEIDKSLMSTGQPV